LYLVYRTFRDVGALEVSEIMQFQSNALVGPLVWGDSGLTGPETCVVNVKPLIGVFALAY